MTSDKEFSHPAGVDRAQNSEQRSGRQHSGLRTLDAHFSAREVAAACHCQYGTGVLREKEHLRARASGERARWSPGVPDSSYGGAAAQDRAGERGTSL